MTRELQIIRCNQELIERYTTLLRQLVIDLESRELKVMQHLMGGINAA